MRKMMNKKGFSLVELMIVVVIMGILIAVAIPLYGAITENANNKTCTNNIKAIKSNAATYKSSYNADVNLAELKKMFDDGNLPDCPFDQDGDNTDYDVSIETNGAVKVACLYNGTEKHAPKEDTVGSTKIVTGVAFGAAAQS